MSETPSRHNFLRPQDRYSVSDTTYFARDILQKDGDAAEVYGTDGSTQVSWYTESGMVELYGTNPDADNIVYQITVNDTEDINGRLKYTMRIDANEREGTIELSNFDDEPLYAKKSEATTAAMNYLRTHPFVPEPLMNRQGRLRLRDIANAFSDTTESDIPSQHPDSQTE